MSVGTRLKKALKTRLKRFQVRGIRFIEASGGRALIGDDMGLGKTIQALGWLAIHPEAHPAIIICPAGLKWNWLEQIKLHTHLEAKVLEGRTPYHIASDICIINYEIAHNWVEQIEKTHPKALIIDECHYIKTRGRKKIKKDGKSRYVPACLRTDACQKIAKGCRHIIALSGTPIISKPAEFFTVLQMIKPKEFSSYWKYAQRYCDLKKGWRGRGWDASGSSNEDELHERVSNIMIRRMKREVLKELPPKQRIVLPVDIDNRREYERAKKDFLEWVEDRKGEEAAEKAANAKALVKIGALKALVSEGKLKAAKQWISDFLRESSEKLVVFCYHRNLFNRLKEVYPNAAFGGKAGEERQKEINRFQNDPECRLFIGTIKADNTGITLTAASTTLFLELGWTPADHDQAEDRVNRIGQEADSISAYYLLAKDTIEEYVWELLEKKREICSAILDGNRKSQMALKFLFDNLKEK